MQTLPGVMATYWRDGDRFVLADTNRCPSPRGSGGRRLASRSSTRWRRTTVPTSSACSTTTSSYGAYGDHGGASKEVQRVPMVFWSVHGLDEQHSTAAFKSTDVMPTILRALGIRLTYPVDGHSRNLK